MASKDQVRRSGWRRESANDGTRSPSAKREAQLRKEQRRIKGR